MHHVLLLVTRFFMPRGRAEPALHGSPSAAPLIALIRRPGFPAGADRSASFPKSLPSLTRQSIFIRERWTRIRERWTRGSSPPIAGEGLNQFRRDRATPRREHLISRPEVEEPCMKKSYRVAVIPGDGIGKE